MRDYQESVNTGQTDGCTNRRRTKWSLCAAMLPMRHKNTGCVCETRMPEAIELRTANFSINAMLKVTKPSYLVSLERFSSVCMHAKYRDPISYCSKVMVKVFQQIESQTGKKLDALQWNFLCFRYCGWLNFRGVPIIMEGPIHEFQYPRIGDFLYELWRKLLWLRILNPTNVSILFNPRKLVPTKIKQSTEIYKENLSG